MKLSTVLSLAILITMAGPASRLGAEQTPSSDAVDIEEFRDALLNYVFAIQEATGVPTRSDPVDVDGGFDVDVESARKNTKKAHPVPRKPEFEVRGHPQDALALAVERARSTPLIDQILELDSEQLDVWMSHLPDPRGHVDRLNSAAEMMFSAMTELARDEDDDVTRRADVGGADDEEAGSGGTHVGDWMPVDPDYPPNSGNYKIHILNELAGMGVLPNPPAPNQSELRCDTAKWGDLFKIWDEARIAAFALEEAFTLASCDPIGVVCLGGATAFAIAKGVMDVASIPIVLCDAHIGNVDSAEIQAAFLNTDTIVRQVNSLLHDADEHHDEVTESFLRLDERVVLLFNMTETHLNEQDTALEAHDTDIKAALLSHDTDIKSALSVHDLEVKTALAAHDSEIKASLATHDADIKRLLASLQAGVDANSAKLDLLLGRQLEVIRLLHTPQGQRSSDVPACDGGPCVWHQEK